MADIFISYSSKDIDKTRLVSRFLESQGWSVWWDQAIPVARSYDPVIMGELEQAKCVIVIWTENSLPSEWVQKEARAALQGQKYVPIRYGVNIPAEFAHIEAASPVSWKSNKNNLELHNLLNAVTTLVRPSEIPEQKKRLQNPGWRSRHFAIVVYGLLMLGLYLVYRLLLRGVGLEYFSILRALVILAISGFAIMIVFNLLCIVENIIFPRLNLLKNIKLWLPSIIFTLCNFFLLPAPKIFRIIGVVRDANNHPVADAQVAIDGTGYFTLSRTDGSFVLQ
ncbi:MAG: TIR domain-containing protein, partial [Chitinophagaceae bacterium]